MCRFLCVDISFQLLLGKYLGTWLQYHIAGETMLSFVRNCQAVSQSDCTVFAFPPAMLFHTITSMWCCQFLHSALLIGVWWYFVVVLICSSLMIYDVEHLFICFLPCAYLLWWDTCSDLLPIFKLFEFCFLSLWEFVFFVRPCLSSCCWILGVLCAFWICLLAIFISSLLRCLFRSYNQF